MCIEKDIIQEPKSENVITARFTDGERRKIPGCLNGR